jgi:two-component system, NarL family, nitrate/nitrite response regulator NarL
VPPHGVSVSEIRVLVIGDDFLARAGLAAVIGADPGMLVVGQAGGPDDAAAGALERVDVVVWDLGHGAKTFLERLGDFEEESPVLALVSSPEEGGDVIRAGARGILLRDAEPNRLVAAIRALATGLTVLDGLVMETAWPARANQSSTPPESLTPREVEVLGLLAEGLSNKAIAERLGISEHTAKFHVTAIIAKLGAGGRTEAVVRAARMGLVVL